MQSNFTPTGFQNAIRRDKDEEAEEKIQKEKMASYKKQIYNLEQNTLDSVNRSLNKLEKSDAQLKHMTQDVQEQQDTLECIYDTQKKTEEKLGGLRGKIRKLYKYTGWIPFTTKYWTNGKKTPVTEEEIELKKNRELAKEKEKKDAASQETSVPASPQRIPLEKTTEQKIEEGLGDMYQSVSALKKKSLQLQSSVLEQQCLTDVVEQKQMLNKEKLDKYQRDLDKL